MVDECRTLRPANFYQGLNQLWLKNSTGASFQEATQSQKPLWLNTWAETMFLKNCGILWNTMFDDPEFYFTTIFSDRVWFTMSGRFHGCFPIKNNSAHGNSKDMMSFDAIVIGSA
jgi:hypothetical protein